MPSFEIKVEGLTGVEAMFLRLSQFQSLLRKPINAGLGEAKRVMQGEVGSRKAKAAIKVYTKKTDTGITGSVGPKGGKTRPGFLAAKFLESGTGDFGPKGRDVHPRSGKVMAIPTLNGTIGPSTQMFTASGRMRKSAAGKAGVVFARSDKGMKPKPWFDRSVRLAEHRVAEAFAAKLHEEIHGGD